jgi:serine/threonine protein phosphatase PrpC
MARVHFSALSDRGIRSVNNDAFCAEKRGMIYLFGVAEGLTGSSFPGTASGIAISCLREAVKSHTGSPFEALDRAVHESDALISARTVTSSGSQRDATHLSACIVDESLTCTILDTGEGNAYIISRDGIHIPREYAGIRHPEGLGAPGEGHGSGKKRGEMISHTLGEPRILTKTDFTEVNLADRFLLFSSGGLYDYVKKDRIADIVLRNGENVETSCELLVQEALSAGSERTITAVLVHGHVH